MIEKPKIHFRLLALGHDPNAAPTFITQNRAEVIGVFSSSSSIYDEIKDWRVCSGVSLKRVLQSTEEKGATA